MFLSNGSAEGIIVPYKNCPISIVINGTDGSNNSLTYAYTPNGGVTLEAGKIYTYNLTLAATGELLLNTVSVTDWHAQTAVEGSATEQ